MLTYLCKYTPLELMLSFGAGFEMPNNDAPDFSATDPYLHSSVCSHAKLLLLNLLQQKKEDSELILTTCCDSIRRVWDALPEDRFAFREMLDLPHKNTGYALEMYTKELQRLIRDYTSYSGHTFDRAKLLEAWRKNAEAWQELLENKSHQEFIAVLGARPSDELFQKIRASLSLPVVNLTCGGLRSLAMPPENAEQLSDEELIHAYAKALLGQVPCMRMDDVAGRTRLLRIRGLSGIVYHTVKFCDYYSFEYAELRRHSDLPILKIESDYTSQSAGQLSTRLAAFDESLGAKGISYTSDHAASKNRSRGSSISKERNTPDMTQSDSNDIFIGIDSGSTTTNVAAIDRSGKLLASSIVRTGAKAGAAAEKAYQEIQNQLGDAASHIRTIIATGYGREFITFADAAKTEISCHAKGAHFADPAARTIIDIGGQDSKVICLDEDGNVMNFVMNDKCAAGTGRFLEMMAHTLEIDMDTMSKLGLKWKKDLNITSTCTVFAESEVVSLIAENAETSDIVHALDKSVAHKTCAMVRRVRGNAPYMMTGGVARNQGVAKEIERTLKAPLSIMKYPDLIGAIGAALFAKESF